MKEKEHQKVFKGDKNDYRKLDEKVIEVFVNKKLRDLEVSKALQKIYKDDFIV